MEYVRNANEKVFSDMARAALTVSLGHGELSERGGAEV
jgi:hypothetical protein